MLVVLGAARGAERRRGAFSKVPAAFRTIVLTMAFQASYYDCNCTSSLCLYLLFFCCSEKVHNVMEVTSGIRHSLVVELWAAAETITDRLN